MAETEYKTFGSVYLCLENKPEHNWNAWEYDQVPSNIKGVDHSFITRSCEDCRLVERLELGFVRAMVEPSDKDPAIGATGNVVQFGKKPA